MCILVTVLAANIAGAAVVSITDPGGLGSVINPLGVSWQEQVGNYSATQFSSNANRLVFNFDNTYYSTVAANTLGNIYLTQGVSGVDLGIALTRVGTYQVRSSGTSIYQTSSTSGDAYALFYKASSGTMTFDHDIYGVGFSINRVFGNITVDLYNRANTKFSTYSMVPNASGTNHSFFGYYNAAAAGIAKIVITSTDSGNQWAVDDFTVIATPEPATLVLLGLGFVVSRVRK
jgi:hypothetical protein